MKRTHHGNKLGSKKTSSLAKTKQYEQPQKLSQCLAKIKSSKTQLPEKIAQGTKNKYVKVRAFLTFLYSKYDDFRVRVVVRISFRLVFAIK